MHRRLLGAHIPVGFWNVGGINSGKPNLFSRKQRSSDLRSPELAYFMTLNSAQKRSKKDVEGHLYGKR